MKSFETLLRAEISKIATHDDPAHDLLHFERVVAMAKKLAQAEGGNPDVIIPASWLHDFVIIPKDDPRRSHASRLSADAAIQFLSKVGYSASLFQEIAHAIEAHSFSAGIECKTLEAKIVQDADRLDGLGAIGIARCFATTGLLKRAFYQSEDPFCKKRTPDDSHFTLDHFYQKLFRTAETLKTNAGRQEGLSRARFMQKFCDELNLEITLESQNS